MQNFQNLKDEIQEMKKARVSPKKALDYAINNMFSLEKTLSLNLYRARVGERFNINESSQFLYNHDICKIAKQRYNKEHEAVLYTSTNPLTAFQELKENYSNGKLYIAVIHSVNKDVKFNCALNICRDNLVSKSNAEKYYKIVKNKFENNPKALCFFSNIGRLLEEDNDYNFSSNYASLLFQTYDSLITVSAVSKGSELNITFNKETTDNKLRLDWVFECEIPDNLQSLCFKVLRIGVCTGNNVEWYNWEIVQGSIKDYDSNILYMHNNSQKQLLYPNVTCQSLEDDNHIGIYNGKKVIFKIKLVKS